MADLPSPDFAYDPPSVKFVAGLRPWRRHSYRLEPENVLDKLIVHNYGHGGAGITMSWGCAEEVRDIISASGPPSAMPIAVLGCGVMGLTTASLLSDLDLSVTIYASKFPPHTTSNVAGGQWLPSAVNFDTSFNGTQKFHRILRRSFTKHLSLIDQGYGVLRRPNFTWSNTGSYTKVPRDLVPEPVHWPRLPFAGHTAPGYEYKTLLVEPGAFLTRLVDELTAKGVILVERNLLSSSDVHNLNEKVIVNCMGLGSKDIWQDDNLIPIKGQLALLRPQTNLEYLYSSNSGYIFPRSDALVIGGTFEDTFSSEAPDPDMCKQLISLAANQFSAGVATLDSKSIPAWVFGDK